MIKITLNILLGDILSTKFIDQDCAITRAFRRAGYYATRFTGISVANYQNGVHIYEDNLGPDFEELTNKVYQMYKGEIEPTSFAIAIELPEEVLELPSIHPMSILAL